MKIYKFNSLIFSELTWEYDLMTVNSTVVFRNVGKENWYFRKRLRPHRYPD